MVLILRSSLYSNSEVSRYYRWDFEILSVMGFYGPYTGNIGCGCFLSLQRDGDFQVSRFVRDISMSSR